MSEREEKVAEISVRVLEEYEELSCARAAALDLFDKAYQELKEQKSKKQKWWKKIKRKHEIQEGKNQHLRMEPKTGEIFLVTEE